MNVAVTGIPETAAVPEDIKGTSVTIGLDRFGGGTRVRVVYKDTGFIRRAGVFDANELQICALVFAGQLIDADGLAGLMNFPYAITFGSRNVSGFRRALCRFRRFLFCGHDLLPSM